MNDNFIIALKMITIFIVIVGYYGLFIMSYDLDEERNQQNEITNNTKIMVDESMTELNEKIKKVDVTTMTDEEYDIMVKGLYEDLESINKNLDQLIKWCEDNENECRKNLNGG